MKLRGAAREADAVAVIPQVVIDFADMDAATDQNQQIKDRTRGDPVVVDLAAWKGLVQRRR